MARYVRTVIEYYWYLVEVDGTEEWIKYPTKKTYKEVLLALYNNKYRKVEKAWIKKSGYYYWEE